MEKNSRSGGPQMKLSFLLKFFRKKGMTSDVFLFSRFYQNDRIIAEPDLPHHNSLVRYAVYFPKSDASGKDRSIWLPNGTTVSSIQMESAQGPPMDGGMFFNSQAAAGNFGGGVSLPQTLSTN